MSAFQTLTTSLCQRLARSPESQLQVVLSVQCMHLRRHWNYSQLVDGHEGITEVLYHARILVKV